MNKNAVIIYLGDFFFDARAINMSLSLRSFGYNVSIVSTDQTPSVSPDFKNIQFYYIKLINSNFKKYLEFIKKVNQILKKNSFSVVIAGDLYSLASGVFYKKGQLIYDSREIYSKLSAHENKPFIRFCVSLYEKIFLKFVDKVIVTAPSDLKYLQNKYSNYKSCSWHVIHNFPLFLCSNSKINIRTKFNIPSSCSLVVYQGVLQKGRGLKQLLLLTAYMPNIYAIIIGGGDSQKKYVKLSKELKVYQKTIFIKKVSYLDLINYTACCDIGWSVIKNLSISNYFALPNKLFEYSLAGLPVVSSNLPNMKAFVEKYDLGVAVSENDLKEQSRAVNFLIENKKTKDFYSNIIKENFTWGVQEKKFIDIVND